MKLDVDFAWDNKLDNFKIRMEAPLSVCFQVTNLCNLTCGHCVSLSGPGSYPGLRLEKIKEILEKLRRSGVMRLNLSGGEPFIRDDIKEIIEYAGQLKFAITITSNGTLIKPEHMDILKRYQVVVQISLDGPEEINNELRPSGSFNSFNSAIQAIKLLQVNKIETVMNFTIQKRNFNYFDETCDIAKIWELKRSI